MKCRELAEFLFEYVSGELAVEQREHFEVHVKRCTNCHEYLIQYEMTIKAGKIACGEMSDELPADIPEELIKAVLSARKV